MKKLSKLLLTLTFALSITSSAFAVVVASWGGAYTESQKLGYGDPTAAALGVPIDWVDYSGGLSEIKAQAEAGAEAAPHGQGGVVPSTRRHRTRGLTADG